MKTVYTYGVFDLLHLGHIQLLRAARALGDRLVVGIFTDAVAASFKRRPIWEEGLRAATVAALEIAAEVRLQPELSPACVLDAVRPAILAKGPGAGWSVDAYPQFPGIQSVLLPYHHIMSTSEIIRRCRARAEEET